MITKISKDILENSNVVQEAPKDEVAYVRQSGKWVDIKSDGVLGDLNLGDGGSGDVVVISSPEFSLDQVIGGTTAEFEVTASSLLNPKQNIEKFVVSVTELDIKDKEYTAENDKATVSIEVPSGISKLTISIFAVDILGNISKTTTKEISVVNAFIEQPSILVPNEDGLELSSSSGIQVTTSEFKVVNSEDIHQSTDYKITSDIDGNEIISEHTGTGEELLNHTFSGLELVSGGEYYIFVRHNGQKFGSSSWSSPRMFKESLVTEIETEGGRKLYRHESGMGTVMEFNDGSPRRVLILDAQYRANYRFGTYGTDNPDLTNFTNSSRYLSTDNKATTTTVAKVITDSWINAQTLPKDNKTSKQNCDSWMKYKDTTDISSSAAGGPIRGVPAVEYCRSISVQGTPCDLPNINTLMRIYCEADNIDSLDPTASSYSKFKLGATNPQGAWCIGTAGASGNSSNALNYSAWSSTECNSNFCWYVFDNGLVRGSYGNFNTKYYEIAVIPVLEL